MLFVEQKSSNGRDERANTAQVQPEYSTALDVLVPNIWPNLRENTVLVMASP